MNSIDRRQDFGEARGFARDAANVLAARHPSVLTTEQRKDARGGRVYADVMRDSYAQTVVAPYSGAAPEHVATPLHWAEARTRRPPPPGFTLRTLGERLAGTPDPWAGMSRHRYDVATARRRAAAQWPNTGMIMPRAMVWNRRLNPVRAGVASESTPSFSVSTACTVKTYRCGGSPAGGAAPPKSFVP